MIVLRVQNNVYDVFIEQVEGIVFEASCNRSRIGIDDILGN